MKRRATASVITSVSGNKFFYLDDLNPRFTLYVLGTEYQQRSPAKRSPELERTVSRAPKKIALASLECLKAGASVCPGGVLEDEAEEQKMLQIEDAEQLEQDENNALSDDSLSDDDLEGVPLAGNWCTDGDY